MDETLPPQKPHWELETREPTDSSPADDRSDEIEMPEYIGPFRVESQIGKGGMGIVYRCYDDSLRRPVAIKVLRRKYSGDKLYRERFRREAQSVASMSHSHVAQIFAISEDIVESGPLTYIVMELVDGPAVEARLHEGERSISPAQATAWTRDAALGLHAAYSKGLVHRDVKPSNLLITPEDGVKIVDFGLAKDLQQSNSLTDPGMVLGTPHYISPEQGRGYGADHRSDIYSLGATYYHMLTGHPPFDGDTQVSVIVKHINEQATPPHIVDGNVPESASAVAMKMMAKKPADRYQDYVELIEDLEAVLANKKPPNAGVRASESTRRRRWPYPVALGAVAIALIALTVANWPEGPETRWEEELGAHLYDRDRNGIESIDLNFADLPPDLAVETIGRTLVFTPPAESGGAATGRPQIDSGVLTWSNDEEFSLRFVFDSIQEVQLFFQRTTGNLDFRLSLSDPYAAEVRRVDLRLRSGSPRAPISAYRNNEQVSLRLFDDERRPLPEGAPFPELPSLGKQAFTVYFGLVDNEPPAASGNGSANVREPMGETGETIVTLRIDGHSGNRIYNVMCALPGTDWSNGGLSLDAKSVGGGHRVDMKRIKVVGRIDATQELIETPWRRNTLH